MILVEKPWGYEKWIAHNDQYVMKEIFIKKGFKTSLQYHNYKKETNYLFSGKIKVTIGTTTTEANQGTIIDLEPGKVHRIEALEDSLLFEASTPHLNDVIRTEDSYGRTVLPDVPIEKLKKLNEGYEK